jgi:hypothetical protein
MRRGADRFGADAETRAHGTAGRALDPGRAGGGRAARTGVPLLGHASRRHPGSGGCRVGEGGEGKRRCVQLLLGALPSRAHRRSSCFTVRRRLVVGRPRSCMPVPACRQRPRRDPARGGMCHGRACRQVWDSGKVRPAAGFAVSGRFAPWEKERGSCGHHMGRPFPVRPSRPGGGRPGHWRSALANCNATGVLIVHGKGLKAMLAGTLPRFVSKFLIDPPPLRRRSSWSCVQRHEVHAATIRTRVQAGVFRVAELNRPKPYGFDRVLAGRSARPSVVQDPLPTCCR